MKKIIIRILLTIVIVPTLYIFTLVAVTLLEHKFGLNSVASSSSSSSSSSISSSDSYSKFPETNPFADVMAIQNEEILGVFKFRNNAKKLLFASDFDGLERTAKKYRDKSDATTIDGRHKLHFFYTIFSYDFTVEDEKRTRGDWDELLVILEKWVEEKPDSITAQVALANFWVDYAFFERSHKYASEVSDEKWVKFKKYMKNANKVLVEARKLDSKCPEWWTTYLTIAKAIGFSDEAYEEIFNEAIDYDQSYVMFYLRKTSKSTPRWGGANGEWEEFAKSSADAIGGYRGDILYSRIVWYLYKNGSYRKELSRSRSIDWLRVVIGVNAMITTME